MNKSDIRKSSALEDLKRMRVYEQVAERGYKEVVSNLSKNARTQYKSIFGIEPHRAPRLRRIFEQASQYGHLDYEGAITEANNSAERVPAEPYEVMLYELQEEVGQALLARIEMSEPQAEKWMSLQNSANRTSMPKDWQEAGMSAIQYIDSVGIDPASRDYWQNVYRDFFE